ncbi:hypothetical protein [Arthrobacter sp. NPDC092385]|uniref:hypothetical protein n=1 Tax=Arthrobacter sp. NPDC092385 TaxID=3363943 RepID=UPI00130DA0DC|nr:hypothetical protein [Vibrio cholerae]
MSADDDDRMEATSTLEYIQESAFPTDLPLFDVLSKFWSELKRILPANHLHVIDPYVLDAGGADPEIYAGNVAALLKPALENVSSVTFVHGKIREGVQDFLRQDIALINPSLSVQLHKGREMHSRHLVTDRSRAVRMEFSFNRIGKVFGTVSFVDDADDIEGILQEVERLHPHTAP